MAEQYKQRQADIFIQERHIRETTKKYSINPKALI